MDFTVIILRFELSNRLNFLYSSRKRIVYFSLFTPTSYQEKYHNLLFSKNSTKICNKYITIQIKRYLVYTNIKI